MVQGPDFKFVGATTPDKLHEAQVTLERAFYDHLATLPDEMRENLRKLEYAHTEQEREAIRFANEITNEMLVRAGKQPFDIPPDNVHILPPEEHSRWIGGEQSLATTVHFRQAVVMNAAKARVSPLIFAATLVHEFFHLKGLHAVEVRDDPEKKESHEPSKTWFRVGISAYSTVVGSERVGSHEHFRGVHEAMAGLVERRGIRRLLELPAFAKEREWMSSDRYKELAREIIRKEQISVPPEELDEFIRGEISWIREDGKEFGTIGYRRAVQVLKYVCQEIQEHYQNYPDPRFAFASWEDVLDEFFAAQFAREKLGSVAKLVENAFGKVAFRILGNMMPDDASASLHMETMKALRRERLKELKKDDVVSRS